MHVFITGATGWVGSAVVQELLATGHRVTGLARSDDKADVLAATGAMVLRGSLDDLDVLRGAARATDAVVHCAFDHDFARLAANSEQDRRAVQALGSALEGSGRPLLVTSGVALVAPGEIATEDMLQGESPHPRRSEQAARAAAARGVRVATIRLPPTVHGLGEDPGFIPILMRIARNTGVSAYIGDGANRWPAVHRLDCARLYRLILERGAMAAVYHAVAEEGIAFRDIATVIGRRLGVPVEARGPEHFGWFADFAAADVPASSARTRTRVSWHPVHPGLLADIDQADYGDRRAA
jgi:nucleoside-diphosphate-sugar epimerase